MVDNVITNEELYNAQDDLAYVRAQFCADCAAWAIRTSQNAEKHYLSIKVARAEVVRAQIKNRVWC